MTTNNTNAGYLFYKDYYLTNHQLDVSLLRKIIEHKDDKTVKEAVEKHFKAKNNVLLKLTPRKIDLELLNTNLERMMVGEPKEQHKFPLSTTYPGLLIGSGYSHETGAIGEFKLGFFFDHTTGLPYIPGSSVKGTLRSVFPQFKPKENEPLMPQGISEDQKNKAQFIWELLNNEWTNALEHCKVVHALEYAIFEGWNIECMKKKALEGKNEIVYLPTYKRDIFFDAVLDTTNVGKKIFASDSITPHPSPLKNPVPLLMFKIAPNVKFNFYFKLTDGSTITATQKQELFKTILTYIGIGAKTNVGYGQLQ